MSRSESNNSANIIGTHTITPSKGSVQVNSKAVVATVFMQLANDNQFNMATESKLHFCGKQLQLPLVLDTTTSINGKPPRYTTKLDELKSAAPPVRGMKAGKNDTKV